MTRRLIALLLLSFAVLTGTAGMATSAHAADQVGGLAFVPPTGTNLTGIYAVTSRGCPAAADAFYMSLKGKGLPKGGQIVTENTAAGFSRTDQFSAYFLQIMRDYATDNGAKTLGGRYDATLYCIDSFTQKVYGTFAGSFDFVSPTKYRATGVNAGTPEPTAPVTPTTAPTSQPSSAPSSGAVASPKAGTGTATGTSTAAPTPTLTYGAGAGATSAAAPAAGTTNNFPLLLVVVGFGAAGAALVWLFVQWKGRPTE